MVPACAQDEWSSIIKEVMRVVLQKCISRGKTRKFGRDTVKCGSVTLTARDGISSRERQSAYTSSFPAWAKPLT